MLKTDLIALGLRGRGSTSTIQPAARTSLERLMTVLPGFVAVVELADKALRDRIEAARLFVTTASDFEQLAVVIEQCAEACWQSLARIRRKLDQRKEIVSLVDLVRETLAIVSGDSKSFDNHFDHSMQRFEALVKMDDVRQLKIHLVQEVTALRKMATERQKAWEQTCEKFTDKVESLEAQLTKTKAEAAVDSLTRVSNRRAFDRTFREWLASGQSQFVLALIDVDNFKSVNDEHGHPAGDRALVAVAQALKTSVRGDDVVARIGGDEFALLAMNLNLRQAENRLKMVGSTLAGVDMEIPGLKITVSCGVVECAAGDTVESLMKRVDSALYEAKRLGKSRVVSKVKPTLHDLMKR